MSPASWIAISCPAVMFSGSVACELQLSNTTIETHSREDHHLYQGHHTINQRAFVLLLHVEGQSPESFEDLAGCWWSTACRGRQRSSRWGHLLAGHGESFSAATDGSGEKHVCTEPRSSCCVAHGGNMHRKMGELSGGEERQHFLRSAMSLHLQS